VFGELLRLARGALHRGEAVVHQVSQEGAKTVQT
jgi:hypothetical protein